jgi:hypothetical protein
MLVEYTKMALKWTRSMNIKLHKFVDEDYIYYTELPEYFATLSSHHKKTQMSNLVIDTRTNQLIKCRYDLEDLLEPLVESEIPRAAQSSGTTRTVEQNLEWLAELKESCRDRTK